MNANLLSVDNWFRAVGILLLELKIAKRLSLTIEKQYLKAPTRLDYSKTITDFERPVNPKNVNG